MLKFITTRIIILARHQLLLWWSNQGISDKQAV